MARTQKQNNRSNPVAPAGDSLNPRREFLVATANMSWQLAVVVLVPIIGGFELDKILKTVPALTIVGFLLAMAGMAFVVWRQLQLYQPPASKSSKGNIK